jgi:hypothetical protein
MADEPDSFRDELEGDISADERARLWRVADALIDARPYPSAAFRAALHQRLSALAAGGSTRERPRALWARVGALALPGLAVLCLVAAGVAHHGPFAP